MKQKLKNLPGFALLELAIALSIMGLIIGLSLPMLTKLTKHAQQQTTNNNQELVFKALGAYALRNKVLPCPSKTLNGIAETTCTHDAQGIVPFETLNIPKSYAIDGFARFFTYVVDSAFTTGAYCSISNTPNPLSFTGSPLQPKNPIAVILISHGQRGHGAFNQDLNKIQVSHPSSLEEENANNDLVFQDFSLSLKEGAEFDHIVKWAAKDFFAASYMASPCKPFKAPKALYTGVSSVPEFDRDIEE